MGGSSPAVHGSEPGTGTSSASARGRRLRRGRGGGAAIGEGSRAALHGYGPRAWRPLRHCTQPTALVLRPPDGQAARERRLWPATATRALSAGCHTTTPTRTCRRTAAGTWPDAAAAPGQTPTAARCTGCQDGTRSAASGACVVRKGWGRSARAWSATGAWHSWHSMTLASSTDQRFCHAQDAAAAHRGKRGCRACRARSHPRAALRSVRGAARAAHLMQKSASGGSGARLRRSTRWRYSPAPQDMSTPPRPQPSRYTPVGEE